MGTFVNHRMPRLVCGVGFKPRRASEAFAGSLGKRSIILAEVGRQETRTLNVVEGGHCRVAFLGAQPRPTNDFAARNRLRGEDIGKNQALRGIFRDFNKPNANEDREANFPQVRANGARSSGRGANRCRFPAFFRCVDEVRRKIREIGRPASRSIFERRGAIK